MNSSLRASARNTGRLRVWPFLFAAVLVAGSIWLATAQNSQGPLIRLRYATFDPLRSTPVIPDELRMPELGTNEVGRFIVQFQGPVRAEWLAELRKRGVVFESYIPDYAFVARMTLRQAAALPVSYSFVRWTGAYHAAYKIDPALLAQRQPVQLEARAFSEVQAAALDARLRQYGTATRRHGAVIQVAGTVQTAAQLARAPEVSWVQASYPKRLYNDRSAVIMGVAASTGVRVRGLYGKDQRICIADSGLDTGNLDTINNDFKGRVIQGIGFARPGQWDDLNGHGTHVAGSVLGSGANSGSNPLKGEYDNSFAGVAPQASLIFQSLGPDEGPSIVIPPTTEELFGQPYSLGARVHTNSWGGGPDDYDMSAAAVDDFIHSHPDLVVLFAAGNDGVDANSDGVVDPRSLGAFSVAKNIICVGASEGNRPNTENWGGYSKYRWDVFGFLAAPLVGDYTSDNIAGMAGFSSRGPTGDGRIKPDVVAPGTNIVSTWARTPALKGSAGWGRFGNAYNDGEARSKYIYMGGTSMATPLVAGAAALVREYYQKIRQWSPSAALVKATLINGARDMNPGQFGTGAGRELRARPDFAQGWGRVDVANSIYPQGSRVPVYMDRPQGLSTGDNPHRIRYKVKNSTEPLRITLAWTDPPASPAANRALVNNLDLRVMDPAGQVYFGNNVAGGDTLNNVEGIDIYNPVPGFYDIFIVPTNIPVPTQTYALVISGDGELPGGRNPDIVPPQVRITSPAAGASVNGAVRVEVTAVDDRGVSRVDLMADGMRIGTKFSAPWVFYWPSYSWKAGSQATLRATATDFGRNSTTDTVTVTVGKGR